MSEKIDDVNFRWAGVSQSGSRKPTNEDSVLVFTSGHAGVQKCELAGNCQLAEQDLVLAVADGMGGAKAGDIASALVLKEMQKIIPETFKAAASGLYPDPLAHLDHAINRVNNSLNGLSKEDFTLRGMGATLAICWFTLENLYVGNVGDSRIYRFRENQLTQLTTDHTYAWSALNRGDVNERQFRSHPRRSVLFEVMGGGHTSVEPHLEVSSYQAGDRFLICSDGVIDGLWDKHLEEELSSEESAEIVCEKLLKRAYENAGSDDTSLLIVEIS